MANLPQNPSMSGAAGAQPNNGWKVQSAEELLIDISNPRLREKALRELCTKHGEELFQDLAPSIWKSFGTVAALIQEITSIYHLLSPPNLTLEQSNTVCNALIVLQSLAVHPETRMPFLKACIPYYVARDKLRYCLPDRLRDATFCNCFEEDPDTKMSLQRLLRIVNDS